MLLNKLIPAQPCISKPSVELDEGDMRDYIEKFRNDPETVFSHTISKDLSDAGNMTAVTFRKQFGRPKYSD